LFIAIILLHCAGPATQCHTFSSLLDGAYSTDPCDLELVGRQGLKAVASVASKDHICLQCPENPARHGFLHVLVFCMHTGPVLPTTSRFRLVVCVLPSGLD